VLPLSCGRLIAISAAILSFMLWIVVKLWVWHTGRGRIMRQYGGAASRRVLSAVGLSGRAIFEGHCMSDIQHLTDESICRLYENIRDQVAADVRAGSHHRLLGETARQQAERLSAEMDRRRLRFTPIDW
jgi:hypothetical protein